MNVKGDEQVYGEYGHLDIMKIQQITFDTSLKGRHGVTPRIGQAFFIGKEFRK